MCGRRPQRKKYANSRPRAASACAFILYVSCCPLRCVLLTEYRQSVDGRFTASGHENGSIYVFNNETGRLLHSLPGTRDLSCTTYQ